MDATISKMWLWIAGFALVGACAAEFIQAMDGHYSGAHGARSVESVTLISAAFFYLIWKKRAKHPGLGIFLGLLVGGALAFAAGYLGTMAGAS